MSDHNVPVAATSFRTEPGHLAVTVEGLRAPEMPFLFERKPERMGGALASSVGVHAALGLIALLLTLYGPKPQIATPVTPDRLNKDIVWLSVPGPGGGGGGGGNQMKEPPRKAELPGKEKITVPAAKLPEVVPTPKPPDPPKPEQQLTIPAKTLGDAQQIAVGAIEGTNPSATLSQGTGTNGGAGTGAGGGIGPGQGSGLGPGTAAAQGAGPTVQETAWSCPACCARSGRTTRPTRCAPRSREPSGLRRWCCRTARSVRPRVVRSLDSTFGLDEEALKAAKQWRFAPGTRFGQAVAVLVTIELTFTLR